MEDAGGLEDRGHDERPRGVRRAGLVAHDVGGGGLAQLGGQRPGGILVHRAEAVLLAVGAHEAERLGLLAAAAPSGPEAAGERGEVEHRNVDRGRPELPIAGAEEEAVEDPGLVLGPRRHPHRRARDQRILPRRLGRDLERSNREREHERRSGGDQWTQGHPTGLRHGDSERDSGQRYERPGEAASSVSVTFCNKMQKFAPRERAPHPHPPRDNCHSLISGRAVHWPRFCAGIGGSLTGWAYLTSMEGSRIMGASHASELPPGGNVPKPRLAWLALFQLAVIAAVVALARITRGFSGPPTLEDRLSAVGEKSLGSAVQSAAWGGRGWLVAVVAMAGALLLMLPIAWAYVATRERRKVDHSVVTTITLLPIAVAAILVIVQDSLAIAFSLAGIAGLVRFRNSLDDTKDAMYVFIAIAVGLGAGVGALEAVGRALGAVQPGGRGALEVADQSAGDRRHRPGRAAGEGRRDADAPGQGDRPASRPNGRMVPAGGGEAAHRGRRGPGRPALEAGRDRATRRRPPRCGVRPPERSPR